MKKLKTALIGCGKVAGAHADAFAALELSDFRAVCGHTPEKTKAFADRYGVRAYTSITEMVKKERIEAVSICTPHPTHAPLCLEAIEAGCHVIVEKPFAVTSDECRTMNQAAARRNLTLAVLFQRRLYEPCRRIRRAIDEGKLGKVILGDVTMLGWRDEVYYRSDPWRGSWAGEGGGVLPPQACHQLDLLLWYMESEIEEVYGTAVNYNHPYIEVEDSALAVIRFRNGAAATIFASNSQNPALFGKVRIHGDNGVTVGVQTDGGAMFVAGMSRIEEAPYNDYWTIPGEEGLLEKFREKDKKDFFSHDPEKYYHQLMLDDFLQAVVEGRKPAVTGEEGSRSVELIEAIYQSSRNGMPVRFPL